MCLTSPGAPGVCSGVAAPNRTAQDGTTKHKTKQRNTTAGDAWDAFLADTAAQPPGCGIPPAGKCGAPLASLYFLPFMLLVSFLLLGILLAVVYEAYDSARPPPMVR